MDLFDIFDKKESEEKPDGYPIIVNVHWYGGVNKLPSDTLYMGRGTPYGNPFTRDEHGVKSAIEKHAVMLSLRLKNDKEFEKKMMTDMYNKKIACFCKNKHIEKPCHLDNYAKEYYQRLCNGWFNS